MLTKSALLCKNANHHLVKRHNVDPAAEANVLRVEAVDALLLQPLLRERVIGCQRGGENRRNDKRQDVETVEEGFFDCTLQVEGRKEVEVEKYRPLPQRQWHDGYWHSSLTHSLTPLFVHM